MAEPTLQDMLSDPTFHTLSPEKQKFYVEQYDPKFKGANQVVQDNFLKSQAKRYQETQARAQQQGQQIQQTTQAKMQSDDQIWAELSGAQPGQGAPGAAPQAPAAPPQESMFHKIARPVTKVVGQSIEKATEPLVSLQRLINGEGAGTVFNGDKNTIDTSGHGGAASEQATQAASHIVPQEPWQAALLAAQAIPGVGAVKAGTQAVGTYAKAANAAKNVGKVAMASGAAQGLAGDEGLLENPSLGGVVKETAKGAAGGALVQSAGEILKGLLAYGKNGIPMIPGKMNRETRIGEGDVANVAKTAAAESPAFKGMQGTPAQMGEFVKGSKGVEEAAGGIMDKQMQNLEQALISLTGKPQIDTVPLRQAYASLLRGSMAKDPAYQNLMGSLRPTPGAGWTPSQARDILKHLRAKLAGDTTTEGHAAQDVINNVVASIEGSLPQGMKGAFSGSQEDMAKAMGLQGLLEKGFSMGPKGYKFRMAPVQGAVSEEAPAAGAQMGPSTLSELMKTLTRGATNKPGAGDVVASGGVGTPYHATPLSVLYAIMRTLERGGSKIGKLPHNLTPGEGAAVSRTGAAVGNAAGSGLSNLMRRTNEE